MSQNVIIGFPNFTPNTTFSGGSYEADLPVTNAGDAELARVARTSDLQESSLVLEGTLSEEQPVRVFGIALPNASLSAEMRIEVFDTSSTRIHDSGFIEVFPEVYPQDDLLWEDDNWWTGKYRQDEITGVVWTRPYDIGDRRLAKSYKISFKDSANADGFLDISYVTASAGWQLGINPAPGAQFGFPGARTRSVQARGGAKTFDRLPKAQRWTGTVQFMDRDESLTRGFEFQRQLDIDQPFLWFPHPDEPVHWLRTVYIARNRSISRLRYATAPLNYTEFPIDVEQVL